MELALPDIAPANLPCDAPFLDSFINICMYSILEPLWANSLSQVRAMRASRTQQDPYIFTMASRALAPLVRRSIVNARIQSRAIRGGSPPMPAFARIPAPTEPVSVVSESDQIAMLQPGCVRLTLPFLF